MAPLSNWLDVKERRYFQETFSAISVVIVWMILSSMPGAYSAPSSEFVSVPGHQTVREGDSVTFICILNTSATIDNASAVWERGLVEELKPNDFTSMSPVNVNRTTGTVTARMRLENVQREMEYFYVCTIAVYFVDQSMTNHLVTSSDHWRLTVLYFLRETDDMQCRGPPNKTFREGTIVSLECVAITCKPELDLTWVNATSADTNEARTERDVSLTCLTWRLKVDRALHNETVFCFATSAAFPERTANCSFGPFSVLHRPSVQVTANRPTLLPPVVTEVELFCQAVGYPTVEYYNWTFRSSKVATISHAEGRSATVTMLETNLRKPNILEHNMWCNQ